MYAINEVAEKFNISKNTLRYYEKEGLLNSIERDMNGIRHYTKEQLETIHKIVHLRKMGASIREIKQFSAELDNQFLSADQLHDLIAFLKKLDQKLAQDIVEIEQQQGRIHQKTTYLEKLLAEKPANKKKEQA